MTEDTDNAWPLNYFVSLSIYIQYHATPQNQTQNEVSAKIEVKIEGQESFPVSGTTQVHCFQQTYPLGRLELQCRTLFG
jgi:hypothetical protein